MAKVHPIYFSPVSTQQSRNNYNAGNGALVANAEDFRMFEATIMQLDDWGVVGLFWHVPAAQNKVAHELAQAAMIREG